MHRVNENGRIPELDGIRGMAIAIVLFFHCFFLITRARPGSLLSYALSPGRLGWSGVDLFFVLSGFLIGGILLDARNASNFYRVFYTRRFFRIVPAYFLLLVAYLVLAVSIRPHSSLSVITDNKLPISPYFLFLQNFWMGAHNTLGGTTLSVTWSLAVEEQFYLTLPFLVRLVPPRRLFSILVAGIGLAELLRLVLLFLAPNNWTFYFVLMPCRADALLLGVVGAYVLRKPNWNEWLRANRKSLWIPLVVSGIGILWLARLLPTTGYTLMAKGGYTAIAIFYLCLLLYGLLSPDSLLSRCLRWRWLGGLGTIAYGVYLLHELMLNAFFGAFRSSTPLITSAADFMLTLAALSSTIVVCWLSWRFFERPLVRIGHQQGYSFDAPVPARTVSNLEPAKTADAC